LILVGDGLSSAAIEANLKDCVPAIKQGLKMYGIDSSEILFVNEMVENDKNVYRPLVVGPHGVEIYEYLWKELQTMISGDKTPKQ
ncbi:ethanolamine ammonia-lyase light chain EutC, partial [Clostridioides difficile]|uniref:ethanolamine ammonia-lyase light chain EutC n=1 Tax=Clostridioides difficile TaxID=1496 RepID=UPI003F8D8EE4